MQHILGPIIVVLLCVGGIWGCVLVGRIIGMVLFGTGQPAKCDHRFYLDDEGDYHCVNCGWVV